MQFYYKISQAFIDQQFIEVGETNTKDQCLRVHPEKSSPEIRALFVELSVGGHVNFSPRQWDKFLTEEDLLPALLELKATREEIRKTAKTELVQLIEAWMKETSYHLFTRTKLNILADKAELTIQERSQLINPLLERVEQAEKEKAAALKESQEREIARYEAEKEARNAQKLEWVAMHGSEHLKKVVERGYNAHRQYIEERAALELPGFELKDVDYPIVVNIENGWHGYLIKIPILIPVAVEMSYKEENYN
jgi:hypothetical protein